MRANLVKRKPREALSEERKVALAIQRAESKEARILEQLLNVMDGVGWSSDQVLARYFGVSRQRIWTWTREGKLPDPEKFGEATTRWNNEKIRRAERDNFVKRAAP